MIIVKGEPGMSDPRHIAIIMDGNGRWAKARGLPRSAGHRAGVEALRETVRAAGDRGLGYLTLLRFLPKTGRGRAVRSMTCLVCSSCLSAATLQIFIVTM